MNLRQNMSKKVQLAVYWCMIVSTLIHGSEYWVCQTKHESKVKALSTVFLQLEMIIQRSICCVIHGDRLKNSTKRQRCVVKDNVVARSENGMVDQMKKMLKNVKFIEKRNQKRENINLEVHFSTRRLSLKHKCKWMKRNKYIWVLHTRIKEVRCIYLSQ